MGRRAEQDVALARRRLQSLQTWLDREGHQGAAASLQEGLELEIVIRADKESDYIGLLPAYSSIDPADAPDLSVLSAGLSEIEIIMILPRFG